MIELDFWQLPDWSSLFATRIEMSRDIPAAEKDAIGTLIQSLDMAKLHKLQDWNDDSNNRNPRGDILLRCLMNPKVFFQIWTKPVVPLAGLSS